MEKVKDSRNCKGCGKNIKIDNPRITFVYCDDCKQKKKTLRIEQKSKNICTNCGKEFQKDPHTRDYHCPECKARVEFRRTHTVCIRCMQMLHRDEFPKGTKGNTCVCLKCLNIEEIEKSIPKVYIRKCKRCGKDIETTNQFATVSNCEVCEEKKQQTRRDATYDRQCIECKTIVKCKGHATIVLCDNCITKRQKLKEEKLFFKQNSCKCKYCGERELVDKEEIKRQGIGKYSFICSKCKIEPTYKIKKVIKKCLYCDCDVLTSVKRTTVICNDCKDIRFKSDALMFTKKKHFGYAGIALDGHKWSSLNEQDLEEWLIARKIKHEPQPRIGETLKHADQYLPEYDLYIEADGLSRTTDVDWQGKLSLYEQLGLKYKIIKPVIHFIESEYKCFEALDKLFEDVIKPVVVVEQVEVIAQ